MLFHFFDLIAVCFLKIIFNPSSDIFYGLPTVVEVYFLYSLFELCKATFLIYSQKLKYFLFRILSY